MVLISLLSSDLNEDFAHCKYLHATTVENLKDMKANEVGHLSVSTLYISHITVYSQVCSLYFHLFERLCVQSNLNKVC